jgi:uncharacterized protein YbaA (DUF1428 family)
LATYVDGYVIPIKKSNVKAYKKMAQIGCKVWLKHGALDYYECVGDDLKAKWGSSFLKLCKLKPSETVVFAFIVYKSKAHRNKVNKAVMSDPAMNPPDGKKFQMPFDMKRFVMGGFKTLAQA